MAWVGYRRVTVGQSCKFCLMLATRGAVYSAESVTFRSHAHCDCGAELESQVDRRHDVAIDPDEAQQILTIRRGAKTYTYDLSQYRRSGVTAPPKAPLPKPVKTVEWKPGQWTEVTPEQVQPTVSQQQFNMLRESLGSAPKTARMAVKEFHNGPCKVTIEARLTRAQTRALLRDIDFALDHLPESVKRYAWDSPAGPIDVIVPVGDATFASGDVGGYVLAGLHRIHLSPAIVKGRKWTTSAQSAPYQSAVSTHRSVVTHELGHIVDDLIRDGAARTEADIAFWEDTFEHETGWVYAKQSPAEGYAEAFAQWAIRGPGSSRVSDAYAARYGWR